MRVPASGWIWFAACVAMLLTPSCTVVRQSPKYGLKDGYYIATGQKAGHRRVFVHNNGDTVEFYTVAGDRRTVETPSRAACMLLPEADTVTPTRRFRKPSMDVDFLTIPFKFRPSVPSLPRQFNVNLNGAVYLGYRTDVYQVQYPASPLSVKKRSLSHYGFSAGVFTGLGSTTMNPWVTNGGIASEYDGVAWSKGVAAIIAVENINAGIALGWDHLLDHNRRVWIYQGRPWLGLAFGLNLN